MSMMTSYIVFWMIIFILLGAFWYVADRRFGVKWYRIWHGLTREKPLPENVDVGFVYNRRSRHKLIMATFLSSVQTAVALISVESLNLLVELVLWIVEVPMTMIGFAIGPWAFKLWRNKNEMLDTLDDLEKSASAFLKDEHADSEAETGSEGEGSEGGDEGSKPAPTEPMEQIEQPSPPESGSDAKPDSKSEGNDDDEPEDPRDMIRRYTSRD